MGASGHYLDVPSHSSKREQKCSTARKRVRKRVERLRRTWPYKFVVNEMSSQAYCNKYMNVLPYLDEEFLPRLLCHMDKTSLLKTSTDQRIHIGITSSSFSLP